MYLSRIIYILLLANLTISCRTENKEINVQRSDFILLDSTAYREDAMFYDIDRRAYYPVYYVGEKTDTIRLGSEPIPSVYNESRDEKYDATRSWAPVTNDNITIVVDTTIHLTYAIHYIQYGEDGNESIDSTEYYRAFPIFITNISNSFLLVGSHNILRKIVREILDENGRWVEVEEPIRNLCGTGSRSIVIEPNNILVAKLIRHKGNIGNKYRLKFKAFDHVVYSNTFSDFGSGG